MVILREKAMGTHASESSQTTQAASANTHGPDDTMPVTIEIINGPGKGLDKRAAGPDLHAFVIVDEAKKNYFFRQNGNANWTDWIKDIEDAIANGTIAKITSDST